MLRESGASSNHSHVRISSTLGYWITRAVDGDFKSKARDASGAHLDGYQQLRGAVVLHEW